MQSGAAEAQTGHSGACMSAGEGGAVPVPGGEITGAHWGFPEG